MEIMQRCQPEVGQLPGDIKMAKVGPRVSAAGRTGAIWINRQGVFFEFSRFYVYSELVILGSSGCRAQQEATTPGYPRGSDAVEGIDPAGDALQKVIYITYTEQMTRSAVVKPWNRPVQDLMHILLAVSQRATNGDAVKGLGGDGLRAFPPQILKPSALYYAIESLISIMISDGLFRPIMGSLHCLLGVIVV